MVTTIKLPALYEKQRAIFFSAARVVACDASTKAGKSVGALCWTLAEAAKFPGASGLWVAPGYAQAKVMFDRMSRFLAQGDPARSCWLSNASDLFIKLPNGAKVWFKGGDNADAIYGSDYSWAVIDEASRCREDTYHAVESTLTATGGNLRVIGNVKGRGNWAWKLGALARSGEPGMEYHKLTALDAVEAGVIRADIVEGARRRLPEHVFRMLYLAEPADDGGNPFGIDAIDAATAPLSDAEPVAWGVDLAKSEDYTVAIALDARGRTCRFERWHKVPWNETTRRLERIIDGGAALIDSTGVGDPIVEGMTRRNPRVQGKKFTSTSKQQMMEGLAAAIHAGEVCFPAGVIVDELMAFEYTLTPTGVRYEAMAGHDDCVCALALAVEMKRRYYPVVTPEPDNDCSEHVLSFADRRKDINWGWGAEEGYEVD